MKLLVVVAHPDDESFGTGSVIADAVANGHDVVVCCATRGEAGDPLPGTVPEGSSLGEVREAELAEAAAVLGVSRVQLLDLADSGWDGPTAPGTLCGAPLAEVVEAVRDVIAAERPDLVITLDPGGGDGHRDHVRIAEATTSAFDLAAQPSARLYYWCLARSVMVRWLQHNSGSVYAEVPEDGFGCPDEDITTVVDVTHVLPRRLAAMACHRSQSSPYDGLPDDIRDAFLDTDRYVRARPPWAGGALELSVLET